MKYFCIHFFKGVLWKHIKTLSHQQAAFALEQIKTSSVTTILQLDLAKTTCTWDNCLLNFKSSIPIQMVALILQE